MIPAEMVEVTPRRRSGDSWMYSGDASTFASFIHARSPSETCVVWGTHLLAEYHVGEGRRRVCARSRASSERADRGSAPGCAAPERRRN